MDDTNKTPANAPDPNPLSRAEAAVAADRVRIICHLFGEQLLDSGIADRVPTRLGARLRSVEVALTGLLDDMNEFASTEPAYDRENPGPAMRALLHIETMQDKVRRYLEPEPDGENIETEHDLVQAIIYLLDGPEQRSMQARLSELAEAETPTATEGLDKLRTVFPEGSPEDRLVKAVFNLDDSDTET